MKPELNGLICSWARHFLTGNPNGIGTPGPKPTDTDLSFYVDQAVDTLVLGDKRLIIDNLLESDELPFAKAAGAQTALLVANTPLAQELFKASNLPAREIKIGGVTRKIAASTPIVLPSNRTADYAAAVKLYLSGISLLKNVGGPLMAVMGKAATRGPRSSVCGGYGGYGYGRGRR